VDQNAVIGGTVGGVAGFVAIVTALVLLARKRRKTTDTGAGKDFLEAAKAGDENQVQNAVL
jgi:hypothetical protein